MSENCNILSLPDELLFSLIEFLNGRDIVCFSLACSRFSMTCRSLRKLYFENCWNTGISIENFKSYLTVNVDPHLIKACNFNNCYWLPANILQNFFKKCSNMEILQVSETKINCGHLAQIFLKCKKITELSLTISQKDLKINQKLPWKEMGDLLQHSCLKDCQDSLKNIVKLEVTFHLSSLQETTLFVSSCDNLKELVLVPLAASEDEDIHNLRFDEMRNPATIKGKFKLHSIILVNLQEDKVDAQAHRRRYQEYLIFQADLKELRYHWNDASPCPITTNQYTSLTYKHLRNPRGMFEVWWAQQNLTRSMMEFGDELEVEGWYLNDPLEDLDLHHVHSLRESIPLLISKRLNTPSLRLVTCFYSNQGFLEFCQSHRRIKVLKLKAPPTFDDWGNVLPVGKLHVDMKEWYSSWDNLTELQTLSIEPSLLAIDTKFEKTSTRKRKFQEANPSPYDEPQAQATTLPLGIVIQSCSRIEELEISTFNDVKTDAFNRINEEDLIHIAQCKLLKKLTLGNFHVSDGLFLEEILKCCSLLESLRLKNLGSPLLCCYTKNLSSSLPSAKKLNTLSIFQRNLVPLGKLLDAVEQIPSLVRLGLVVPSDDAPFKWTVDGLTGRLHVMFKKLPNLVAFFSVLNIPKLHSSKATKKLHQLITPKRPSFCVDIQGTDKPHLDHKSLSLPLIHREILVNFNSRVGVVPLGFNSSVLH